MPLMKNAREKSHGTHTSIANCESSRVAVTTAACAVANVLEDFQGVIKRRNEDREEDEAANAFGRSSARRRVVPATMSPMQR